VTSVADGAQPAYSIVVTCYGEARTIDEFHRRLSTTMRESGRSYEIVYVNDGSADETLDKLARILEDADGEITVIDLFFNAGQLAAATAGFSVCRGAAIVIIDSDLQLAPEELPLLIDEYEKGYDMVSGYRVNRRDPLIRKVPSFFLNLLIRRRSARKLRDFGCTMKIFDARIIQAFGLGPMRPLRPASLVTLIANCSEVAVTHYPRRHGKSGWEFGRLFTYSLDSIVGIGAHPWLMGGLVGGSIAVLAGVTYALNELVFTDFLNRIAGREIFALLLLHIAVSVFIVSWVIEFVVRKYTVSQYSPAYIVRDCRSNFGREKE